METIWKYELEITDRQSIEMPEFCELLSVQVQNGVPCLWVKVNTDIPENLVTIVIYGTGHPIKEVGLKFIDTFQVGELVFHVFRQH